MKNIEETDIEAGAFDTLTAATKAAELVETLSKETLTVITLTFPDLRDENTKNVEYANKFL